MVMFNPHYLRTAILAIAMAIIAHAKYKEDLSKPIQFGRVLLGGNFTFKDGSAENLALFDLDTNNVKPFYNEKPNGKVHVIKYEPRCDFMVIGGSFSTIDGYNTGPLAFKMDVSNSDWNNHTWHGINAIDSNLSYGDWSNGATIMSIVIVFKEVMKPCRPLIIMAGKFTKIAGIEKVNNIAALNTVDMTWNFYKDGNVNGIEGDNIQAVHYNTDYLYAGGSFPGFFKRYGANGWETILQGQLNGPVTSITSQASLVHKGNIIVGGSFTKPHKYLLKISRRINIAPNFRNAISFTTQNGTWFSSEIQLRKMYLVQDQLHIFGYFSVAEVSHYAIFNVENGRILSNTSKINEFRKNINDIPQCGASCSAPFDSCMKGSNIIATREYQVVPDSANRSVIALANYLTLVLGQEELFKTFHIDVESDSLDIVSSMVFMPRQRG